MLTPNPIDRPSIQEILNILNNWEKIDKIELNVINPTPRPAQAQSQSQSQAQSQAQSQLQAQFN